MAYVLRCVSLSFVASRIYDALTPSWSSFAVVVDSCFAWVLAMRYAIGTAFDTAYKRSDPPGSGLPVNMLKEM